MIPELYSLFHSCGSQPQFTVFELRQIRKPGDWWRPKLQTSEMLQKELHSVWLKVLISTLVDEEERRISMRTLHQLFIDHCNAKYLNLMQHSLTELLQNQWWHKVFLDFNSSHVAELQCLFIMAAADSFPAGFLTSYLNISELVTVGRIQQDISRCHLQLQKLAFWHFIEKTID